MAPLSKPCTDEHVLPRVRDHHGRRVLKPQHRTTNHLVRAHAKHLANNIEEIDTSVFSQDDVIRIDKASLRPQLENKVYLDCRAYRQFGSHKDIRAPRSLHVPDEDEGMSLAYSEIGLPSDASRLARRPTLEREDAFRVTSTSKGNKIYVRRRQEPVTEDQQVAELYRMGLLYDDESDRGAKRFDLNSIQHEEPVYTIRPSKRSRKPTKGDKHFDEPLRLDLSFSDLGAEDDTLAQCIVAMNGPEGRVAADQGSRRGAGDAQPLLRIIYELTGSQDIDPRQATEFLEDIAAEYDCLTYAELDDTVQQEDTEEDADDPPGDAWVVLRRDAP